MINDVNGEMSGSLVIKKNQYHIEGRNKLTIRITVD